MQTGKRFKPIAVLALVLASMAVPLYRRSLQHTKETLLKNDLFTLRVVIDEYTFDQQKAPRTMRDLVDSGYLRSVPMDPFTGKELSTPLPGR